MKKRLAVSLLLALVASLFVWNAKAEGDGTLKVTFLYMDSGGVIHPLDNAWVYLQDAAQLNPIMEKYFRYTPFVFGPTDANGSLSVSVPDGVYRVRITRRAPLSATPTQNQAFGPPRPGDYTWYLKGFLTVTDGAVIDLGTVYAGLFDTPSSISISGQVMDSSGAPLPGWFVMATDEPCIAKSGCSGTKYPALLLTDANGNYTINLRNPGTYFVYASPIVGAQGDPASGQIGYFPWATCTACQSQPGSGSCPFAPPSVYLNGCCEEPYCPLTVNLGDHLTGVNINVLNPAAPVLTTINPAPVLISLSPETVAPNTDAAISLTGNGFITNSVAAVDGSPVASTYIDASHINILVPAALLPAGNHSVTVSNPAPGGGASNALNLTASSPLPPSPQTVAPPLDPTVATTTLSATQFLYSGANPIQNGVAPGTIQVARAAVIRGRVLNPDGSALAGVSITILGHPEFGGTMSRSDGAFDMAVNGGGVLTVVYSKTGYLTIEHQVNVPWQDYAMAPDAVLNQTDPRVSSIDLTSSAPIQVAQGSQVTDSDGTRQATLLFEQGTTATMVMPDGSTQPLANLSVRATEFTVGPNGIAAMPGPLPPNVAYTYAVDYSVDQAVAAGAKSVQFSQPVYSYTNNFLNFHVGTLVPSAYYDQDRGVWVPSDNGLVIGVLSISNGMAVLDVDGNGVAATPQELANLGITNAELTQLASLYQPGQSFWRVPIRHFTYYDFNWGQGSSGAITPSQSNSYLSQQNVDKSCTGPGCIIEMQNQTLGETLNISGTPFTLNYRSSVQPGRQAEYVLNVPLSGTTLPPSLKRIDLEIDVAGQTFKQSFSPAPNQTYSFAWNGSDAYARPVQGSQSITSKIGYVYDAVYLTPSENGYYKVAGYGSIFGHCSYFGQPASSDRTRMEMTLWQINQNTIGSSSAMGHWDAQAEGFGGWTLSVQNAYDPVAHVLYMGDGSERSVNTMNNVIETMAGNGTAGYAGDSGPASQAALDRPSGVAVDGAGNIYVADTLNNRIRKIGADGIINAVAGNGAAGYSGDGGPAINAELDR
ncbi:MAG: IPT/TIG domain-containing protein, partial [Nitrospiraceae bacterium]|nr:IPT/TIG domain-containing protein [Nitrospiraceae bacterium]